MPPFSGDQDVKLDEVCTVLLLELYPSTLYTRLSISRSVGWSMMIELLSEKICICAPTHLYGNGGHVCGLVEFVNGFFFFFHFSPAFVLVDVVIVSSTT